jgi:hypothetical protein
MHFGLAFLIGPSLLFACYAQVFLPPAMPTRPAFGGPQIPDASNFRINKFISF